MNLFLLFHIVIALMWVILLFLEEYNLSRLKFSVIEWIEIVLVSLLILIGWELLFVSLGVIGICRYLKIFSNYIGVIK